LNPIVRNNQKACPIRLRHRPDVILKIKMETRNYYKKRGGTEKPEKFINNIKK